MNLTLPKGISYVVIAGVAGLVATFTIHRYVSLKTRTPVVATGQVAVATVDISPGTALNGKLIKETSWPKELVPSKAASSLRELEGRVVLTAIVTGEPILQTKLAPVGTAAGLSGLLGNDKRALTVRVDDVSGVGGFIHPGDRVDVLADLKIPNTQENFSKTILQGISVLTAGQIMEQKGDNKPAVVNTVTLELTPEQAEVLNLASNEGKIRLSLRNRQNLATVNTAGVATSSLVPVKGGKAGEAKLQKDGQAVEVIKGLERTRASM